MRRELAAYLTLYGRFTKTILSAIGGCPRVPRYLET